MSKEILQTLFERDLQRLKTEINLYQSDEDLWKKSGQIPNSGGNLCLHLIGNLRHFIGTRIGKTGFVRNRDAEFSDKNISREKLLSELDDTSATVARSLSKLTDEVLARDFADQFQDKTLKTDAVLFHILNHLNYHLGQINYHRRFFS